MPIKVAVASSDGKIVNQHFGKAQKFLIFEINNNSEYEFIELRQTVPRCGEDPDIKYGIINLISGYSAGKSNWAWRKGKTVKKRG